MWKIKIQKVTKTIIDSSFYMDFVPWKKKCKIFIESKSLHDFIWFLWGEMEFWYDLWVAVQISQMAKRITFLRSKKIQKLIYSEFHHEIGEYIRLPMIACKHIGTYEYLHWAVIVWQNRISMYWNCYAPVESIRKHVFHSSRAKLTYFTPIAWILFFKLHHLKFKKKIKKKRKRQNKQLALHTYTNTDFSGSHKSTVHFISIWYLFVWMCCVISNSTKTSQKTEARCQSAPFKNKCGFLFMHVMVIKKNEILFVIFILFNSTSNRIEWKLKYVVNGPNKNVNLH